MSEIVAVMSNNSTSLPSVEKLGVCDDFSLVVYSNFPAEGAHLISNVVIAVFNFLLSIVGTFSNLLVITVYGRSKDLRKRSSNLPYFALSVSDLVVTAVVQPLSVVRNVLETLGKHYCPLWLFIKFMSILCCGVSLGTIGILSIERFITLARPYDFGRIVSQARLKKSLFSLWLFALTLITCHLAGLMTYSIFHTILAILLLFIVLSVVSIWIWIHRLIRRHRHQIESSQRPSFMSREAMSRRRLLQTTKTSYLIVGSVLFCYLHALVLFTYIAIEASTFVVMFFFAPWTEVVVYANSLFNPLILFYRKRDFRKGARTLLF